MEIVAANFSRMTALNDFYLILLGPDGQPKEMTLLQISVRCILIFLIGLALVRIGDRRSLSQKTGFDALFIVLLGSVLSRAINGTSPFSKTVGAGLALMVIHRLFAFGACRSHAFGKLIKGRDVTLVRDGKIDWKAMNQSLVSQHDLEEDVRLEAKVEDLSKIARCPARAQRRYQLYQVGGRSLATNPNRQPFAVSKRSQNGCS
jgi:hypothetical protein